LPDEPPNNADLRRQHAPLSKFIEGSIQAELLFKPGTRFSYSSSATILVAEIVQRLSGRSIQEFVRREILEPLELNLPKPGRKSWTLPWARRTTSGMGRLLAALAVTIALGVLSRAFPIGWAPWDNSLGDVLYAVAAYLALAVLLAGRPRSLVAALALGWCLAVEFFQATGIPARYPDVAAIRWLVGTTFSWHDVACYVVGVAAITATDALLLRPSRRCS
jgi:hypothetical protein